MDVDSLDALVVLDTHHALRAWLVDDCHGVWRIRAQRNYDADSPRTWAPDVVRISFPPGRSKARAEPSSGRVTIVAPGRPICWSGPPRQPPRLGDRFLHGRAQIGEGEAEFLTHPAVVDLVDGVEVGHAPFQGDLRLWDELAD
jgi:hypothetical protein